MLEGRTLCKTRFEMDKGSPYRVCVTGAASYVGSSLVKKLLEKGYTVHATLRNLNDESKVSLLKSFPNAKTRLELFEADIYEPESFEDAIQSCHFVVHVAHPMCYSGGHKHKNVVEATVTATRSIASACKRSGTVKRLIYTASVVAASPLKEREGYKEFMDETCWTPLHIPVAYCDEYLKDYTNAKTVAEKDLLNLFNNNDDDDGGATTTTGGLEVVTLACGLVGGETCLPTTPLSTVVLISPISNNGPAYHSLKYLDELLGKVPIVHIDDVVEAHVFCFDAPSLTGRVLCASSYVSAAEIAHCFRRRYPEFNVPNEYLTGPRREIQWRSTRLTDKGFKYKYENMEMILDDCISSARRIGDFQLQQSC